VSSLPRREGRSSLWSAYTQLHYRVRTEGDTPGRKAAAIALGVFLGCFPLWGLHLALCAVAARLFQVNRLTTYFASYVNNPITVPFLLYAEYGVGHWLRTGDWPALALRELGVASLLEFGGELLLGSAAVGVVLGAAFGSLAWAVGGYWRAPSLEALLRETTSRRYLGAGAVQWEIVRGKLRYDPLYFAVLRAGMLPERGRLLDLGCGRGILMAVIVEAGRAWRQGAWDGAWPRPPLELELVGIERQARLARIAREALAGCATLHVADLVDHEPEPADAIVITDTLHHLPAEVQPRLLHRACSALRPGGVLVLREVDGSMRVRCALRCARRWLRCWLRGRWHRGLHFRPAETWRRLLEREGLSVRLTLPARGRVSASVIIEARKAAVAVPTVAADPGG
jgi:uncharacterized protein (DUF2062 family)/protein-L-isoaspartate O-methyltransferase